MSSLTKFYPLTPTLRLDSWLLTHHVTRQELHIACDDVLESGLSQAPYLPGRSSDVVIVDPATLHPMPVMVWSVIRERLAYQFFDHIDGPNRTRSRSMWELGALLRFLAFFNLSYRVHYDPLRHWHELEILIDDSIATTP